MNQRTDPLAAQRMDRPTVVQPPHAPSQENLQAVLTADKFQDSLFKLMLDHKLETARIARQAFNFAHPVDEYEVVGQNASTLVNGVQIRRDTGWQQRYQSILYSLGLGVTSAVLVIGQTTLQLYNGAAIAVQQPVCLNGLGILSGPDDKLALIVGGAATTDGFIKLMGYAFKRNEAGI
jgi:hypothetical protein